MSDYKFIVVPLDSFTKKIIVDYLIRMASISGSEVIFDFEGKEKVGYSIPHQFVAMFKNNRNPRLKMDFYEQQVVGFIGKYKDNLAGIKR